MCKTNCRLGHLLEVAGIVLFLISCVQIVYAQETPEVIILLHQRLEEKPEEVKAAWLSYGLIMKIQITGYCSRHNSTEDFKMTFEMERGARAFLAEMWSQYKSEAPEISDNYLDDLLAVVNSGYLSEYIYIYYRQDFWSDIPDLKLDEFSEWCNENLKDHKFETLSKAVIQTNN